MSIVWKPETMQYHIYERGKYSQGFDTMAQAVNYKGEVEWQDNPEGLPKSVLEALEELEA